MTMHSTTPGKIQKLTIIKCTDNSGTLSYKEIQEIIDTNQLTPIYDRENAVKYIVWDSDQWVSYVRL